MKTKFAILITLLLLPTLIWAQEVGVADSMLLLRGRVTAKGKGIPYATLQLKGTSKGVSCNDAGEYELKIPARYKNDTILVRAIGYSQSQYLVASLTRRSNLKLEPKAIELREVSVTSFRSARHLILAAVDRIPHNYHQKETYSTFFFRDWRSVDNELYLFDEAVMGVRRCAYSQYADKRGYRLNPMQREMESNYKELLRHRLVVCDRECLRRKIESEYGVEQMLEYADNDLFYDPVATPQASYSLAKRMLKEHDFDPIREFVSDGEAYYLVTSIGPNRRPNAKMRNTWTIRKSDLAIVSITSAQLPISRRVPDDLYLNSYFNRMVYDADSSSWTYDVRDGHHTLTHYYNLTSYTLSSNHRGHESERQQWQHSTDWTLTDFSLTPPTQHGDTLEVKLQTRPGAFGSSDYSTDFWGHFNSIPLDTFPLRLLKEKIQKP